MKRSTTKYQTTTEGEALIVETNDFILRRDTSISPVCAFAKPGNMEVEIGDLPNQDLVEQILRSAFNIRTHRRHGRVEQTVAGVKLFILSRTLR